MVAGEVISCKMIILNAVLGLLQRLSKMSLHHVWEWFKNINKENCNMNNGEKLAQN